MDSGRMSMPLNIMHRLFFAAHRLGYTAGSFTIRGVFMTTATMPSAEIVFDTMFAYQRSAALKSAIDLDLFTHIDTGEKTSPEIASRTGASERGIRILCDYLCTIG